MTDRPFRQPPLPRHAPSAPSRTRGAAPAPRRPAPRGGFHAAALSEAARGAAAAREHEREPARRAAPPPTGSL